MTFRERWLQEANKASGLRKRRMLRLADNPQAMKRMEQAARDKLGLKASDKADFGKVDWSKLLPILMELLPVILKLFSIA